jgi:hypothetical protein
MSLDGLRAWIGEVERKLDMRTKVMLVLAAIAIGAAGTAIYLVIDIRDKAVSESDVQELQTQLESQIDAGGGATEVAGLQAEIDALEAQVEELQNERGGGKGAGGKGGNAGGGASGGTGGGASGGAGGGASALPELPDAQNLPGIP